jgi:BirA family biotin operon repressor/biotin-[acetyl-CoA-carboxylase] ligase
MIRADLIGTLPGIAHYLLFDELESTNTFARELGVTPSQKITVIRARKQNAGRGRHGRSFFSSVEGGLWVSLIVAIDTLDHHVHLHRCLGLAIADALCALAPQAGISLKWPNDVYCNKKKICGILLEATAGSPAGIIAGFGLNVNIRSDQFPASLAAIATSLLIETGVTHDCDTLLADILTRFDLHYHSDPETVYNAYCTRLYRLGETISINQTTGVFTGVLPDGRIGIRGPGGMSYFSSGDIGFSD